MSYQLLNIENYLTKYNLTNPQDINFLFKKDLFTKLLRIDNDKGFEGLIKITSGTKYYDNIYPDTIQNKYYPISSVDKQLFLAIENNQKDNLLWILKDGVNIYNQPIIITPFTKGIILRDYPFKL